MTPQNPIRICCYVQGMCFEVERPIIIVIIGISNGYHLLLDQPASAPNIVHELNTCHVNKNIHLLPYLLSIISLILDSVKSFAGPDLKVPYPSIPD